MATPPCVRGWETWASHVRRGIGQPAFARGTCAIGGELAAEQASGAEGSRRILNGNPGDLESTPGIVMMKKGCVTLCRTFFFLFLTAL